MRTRTLESPHEFERQKAVFSFRKYSDEKNSSAWIGLPSDEGDESYPQLIEIWELLTIDFDIVDGFRREWAKIDDRMKSNYCDSFADIIT